MSVKNPSEELRTVCDFLTETQKRWKNTPELVLANQLLSNTGRELMEIHYDAMEAKSHLALH